MTETLELAWQRVEWRVPVPYLFARFMGYTLNVKSLVDKHYWSVSHKDHTGFGVEATSEAGQQKAEEYLRTLLKESIKDGASKEAAVVYVTHLGDLRIEASEVTGVWRVLRGEEVQCFGICCPESFALSRAMDAASDLLNREVQGSATKEEVTRGS